MGIFRKPIRALDRLPSRFRAAGNAPTDPVPASGRADAFVPKPSPPEPPAAGGPGNAVTFLIVVLSATLLGGVIILWRAGAAGPQTANGAPSSVAKPQSVEALLGAAKSFVDQQDFAKAEAILRAAVREHPEDQELRLALGETLVRLKRPADAYEQYARAIEIGPREPRLDFAAGTLASQAGRLPQAADHYRAAQAADPGNAQYPLYLAQVQIKQQDFGAARMNLLMAAKLDPQSAAAWGSLAELFLKDNKLDLTLQNITKARAIQPEVARWKVVEAKARARRGDPTQALVILNTLDRSEQHRAPALPLMGECYGLLGRQADAAQLYSDASDAAPTDPTLAYEAAMWADRAGDRQTAVRLASRAAHMGHDGAKALLAKL